jgi:hypothetical protein
MKGYGKPHTYFARLQGGIFFPCAFLLLPWVTLCVCVCVCVCVNKKDTALGWILILFPLIKEQILDLKDQHHTRYTFTSPTHPHTITHSHRHIHCHKGHVVVVIIELQQDHQGGEATPHRQGKPIKYLFLLPLLSHRPPLSSSFLISASTLHTHTHTPTT